MRITHPPMIHSASAPSIRQANGTTYACTNELTAVRYCVSIRRFAPWSRVEFRMGGDARAMGARAGALPLRAIASGGVRADHERARPDRGRARADRERARIGSVRERIDGCAHAPARISASNQTAG